MRSSPHAPLERPLEPIDLQPTDEQPIDEQPIDEQQIDEQQIDEPDPAPVGPGERFRSLLPWALLAAVPAMAHLMFGVDDVGLVEEWGVLHRMDTVGSIFWAPFDRPVHSGQAIRPLTLVPHSLARLADRSSFVWFHVLHAAALSLKAIGMFLVLRHLRFRPAVCFTGALVFALLPAWDSLFTFRTIHIQIAVAFLAIAIAQLLAFADRPSWLRGVAIGIALTISLLHYEVGYILVALAPALVFVRHRLPARRLLVLLSVWYLVPAVNGVRIIALLRSDEPLYQETMVQQGQRRPIAEIWDLTQMAVGHGVRSWIDPPAGFSAGMWFAVLAALALTGLLLLAIRAETMRQLPMQEAGPRPGALAVACVAVGSIAAAPAAALVFWVNSALMTDPLRVFSAASLPLALAVAALLELVGRGGRAWVAVGLSGALLLSTTSAAVEQRRAWNERSVHQMHVLGAVVASVPEPGAVSGIVVIDPQRVIGGLYTLLPAYLQLAGDLLLPGGPQAVALCQQTVEEVLAAPPPEVPTETTCAIADGLVTTSIASVGLDAATVVEIRRATGDAAWAIGPVDSGIRRIEVMLPCVEAGTCDDGPFGIEARVVRWEPAP